jgi:hypothetical protein
MAALAIALAFSSVKHIKNSFSAWSPTGPHNHVTWNLTHKSQIAHAQQLLLKHGCLWIGINSNTHAYLSEYT